MKLVRCGGRLRSSLHRRWIGAALPMEAVIYRSVIGRMLHVFVCVLAITMIVGCAQVQYAKAEFYGYQHSRAMFVAVQRYLVKRPVIFYISVGPARESAIHGALVQHGVLKAYKLSPSRQKSDDTNHYSIDLELTKRGRNLARRDGWRRMGETNTLVIQIGTLNLMRIASVSPIVAQAPANRSKMCYNVRFVARFILTRAGRDLRPLAPQHRRLAGAAPDFVLFGRSPSNPQFAVAGKNVTGSMLVCNGKSGEWNEYYP